MSERTALLCDIQDGAELCGQLAAAKCALCGRDCCARHRSSDRLQIHVRANERAATDSVGRLGYTSRVLCDPCGFALKKWAASTPDTVLSADADWDASVLVAVRALVAEVKLKEST